MLWGLFEARFPHTHHTRMNHQRKQFIVQLTQNIIYLPNEHTP